MQEQVSIDVLIVGAGVVGLAIAKKLKETYAHLEIAVIDKMPYLAEHASGRNSGVLHAGLYYPNDSLKKRLCIRGNQLWREWAQQCQVEIHSCGKFILANRDEEKRFLSLYEQAKNNGAKVELVSDKSLQEIAPFSPADLAFFSKNTAILDPSMTINKLAQFVESLGVMLLLQHELHELEQCKSGFLCKVNDFSIKTGMLVNSAGSGAITIRKMIGLVGIEQLLVKGHYLKTFQPFYNKSLLYRLPEQQLKGLGIHTCIDFDGTVKFGPDTKDVEDIDYSLDSNYIEKMKDTVTHYFKISREKLHGDFAGIRTKILSNQKLYSDFWIESPLANYVELCGIESPGLTSAPAIAEYLQQHFFHEMLES